MHLIEIAFLEERIGMELVVKQVRNSLLDELAGLMNESVTTYKLCVDGTEICIGTVKVKQQGGTSDDGYTPIPYSISAKVKIPDRIRWVLPWPLQKWTTLSHVGKYDYSANFVEGRTDNYPEIPFP